MKKDDIEKIYSQLEGFSKEPPAELWDNIEERLHPKKKRRGLIWFWGSAAAIIILLIGFNLKGSLDINNETDMKVTDIENNETHKNENNNQLQDEAIESDTEIIVDNTGKNIKNQKSNTFENPSNNMASQDELVKKNEILNKDEKLANTNIIEENPEENISLKNKNNNNENYALSNSKTDVENIETNNDDILKKDNAILKQLKKETNVAINDSVVNSEEEKLSVNPMEKLVAEKEDEKDNIEEETNTGLKWSLELLGGLSNTASDSYVQNTSVNTQSQNDFVYALRFGYSISDRLVVKSGIGKNTLGQEVNNIVYASSDASLGTDASSGPYLVSNNELSFYPNQESYDEFSSASPELGQGVLRQQLDFVQVPLEVSYSLLKDQNYNLSFGLGGNVNFLTNNRAYLDDEQIGESRNVESTIFGATLNSNFSYKLSKNINLFVEPSYNYFQKPVDNTNQNFKNTQFRALFGLRYGF